MQERLWSQGAALASASLPDSTGQPIWALLVKKGQRRLSENFEERKLVDTNC
jgi:hypothetical protein